MSACHRCGTAIGLERIGVRDVCEGCGAWLHCCRNCEFYEPGAHNDCREPAAEMVADKEQGNFCEYFRPSRRSASSSAPDRAAEAKEKLEKLFKR